MLRGLFLAAMCLATAPAMAQDPVQVDPQHYRVEFENAQVRVLRVHYGPHEKSVMHQHPATVPVFLTDGRARFTYPDGRTNEQRAKTGDTHWEGPVTHLPENPGDEPFELVLVELKAGAGTARAYALHEPQKAEAPKTETPASPPANAPPNPPAGTPPPAKPPQ